MAVIDTAMQAVHLVFAGVWTGSVVFVAYAVLPTAASGEASVPVLEAVLSKLKLISRASAVLLFVTGGHLAAALYTVESLTGSPTGHAVLAMLVLWFLLAALVEIGASRAGDALEAGKIRTAAADGGPFLKGAAVVAVLLLVDAGYLSLPL
jgi:hypothetical protein